MYVTAESQELTLPSSQPSAAPNADARGEEGASRVGPSSTPQLAAEAVLQGSERDEPNEHATEEERRDEEQPDVDLLGAETSRSEDEPEVRREEDHAPVMQSDSEITISEDEPEARGAPLRGPDETEESNHESMQEDDFLQDGVAERERESGDDEEFQAVQPRGASRSARRRQSRVATYSSQAVEIIRVTPLSDERVSVLRELLQRYHVGLRSARADGDWQRVELLNHCIQVVQKVIDLEYHWRRQPTR